MEVTESAYRTAMTLMNLGELVKPATVLIEKISDAIGGIARPYQIVRIAEAEGKAELVRANNRISISEMEERALQRMVREEGKRQENIEAIALQAAEMIGEDARPNEIEKDWLVHLFDKGRLISDEKIQRYWAGMLASQAEHPGKFSKRTIDLLASLDKEDIHLFSRFSRCVWHFERPTPIVYKIPSVDTETCISFDKIKHLEGLGILHVSNSMSPFGVVNIDGPCLLSYGDQVVELTAAIDGDHEESIETGQVILTSVGAQLLTLCEFDFCSAFFEETIVAWMHRNYLPRQSVKFTSPNV